jgi:hypothetical protein
MRIGSNSAAAVSADTNVKTAIATTLHTCDSKTLLAATRTMQWVRSYPSGAGGTIISVAAIKEVCVLNQLTSPGGSALMRTVFTTVAKTKADKLKITYRARVT